MRLFNCLKHLLKCIWGVLVYTNVLVLFSCQDDYNDAWIKETTEDLKNRVLALEEWQKAINTNIESLQSLIEALEEKDYVTGVTELSDGKGYVISFQQSGDITIKNGESGNTPVIGVEKDETDEKYYWTINGEFLKDHNGLKLPVTGEKGEQGEKGADAIAPQIRINSTTNEWEISIDGGETFTSTKIKATGEKGDAIFNSIDHQNNEYVIFTLADGTTSLKLPKYQELFVQFDSNDTFYCSEEENEIILSLPNNLKEEDYTALVATVTHTEGINTDLITRTTTSSQWGVKIVKPTFKNGMLVAGSAKVQLTLPENKSNYKALLKVTLVDAKGQEHSVSRIVWFRANGDANVIENTSGILSDKVTAPENITQLSLIGTLSETDFRYIRDNMTALEILDLSRTTLTELPTWAMAFYPVSSNHTGNHILHTVILPETLVKIGRAAFGWCYNLQHINLPNSLKEISSWTFEGCRNLSSITIPENVDTIGQGIFYQCSALESVRIAAHLTKIPELAFYLCYKLKTINLPHCITEIGADAFNSCEKMTGTLNIPSATKTIGARAFSGTEITAVYFPEGLEELGEAAFYNCRKLTEVTLPASLKKMNDGTFFWSQPYTPDSATDPYVRKLTFKGTTPPEITYTYSADEEPVLQRPDVGYMQACKVYVPASSINTYKQSVWFTGTNVYGTQQLYFNENNLSAITE